MGDDKNHLYSKEDYQKDQQENAKRRTQQGFSRFSIAQATSLNDAGNTQAPEAMQLDTRNSWFRGINDTFDDLSLVTVDVFFGTTNTGVRKYVTYNVVTVTDDVTFAFSGTPFGKMLPFTLDITIDKPADPRPIILWSSSLVNPPTMPTLTDGLRLILHFETVQDGVSERQVYIGGTIGSGGAGSQTPWLSNIDADGFNLFDLSNLLFRESTQTLPIGTDTAIWRESDGLHFNVPDTKQIIFEINDVTELTLSSTAVNFQNNDAEAIDRVRFVNQSGVVVSTDDPSIFTDAGLGLIYNAKIGTDLGHFWKTGDVTKMSLTTDVTSLTILELIAGTAINDVPIFKFDKTHPTPVSGGIIGETQWLGTRTGNAALVSYGSITVSYEDIVVGTHSGTMKFNVITGGTTDKIFMRYNLGNTGILEVFEPLEMNTNIISNMGGGTISDATDIVTVDAAADFLLILDASAPTTLKKVKVEDLPGGSDTPWTVEHDAATFDLFNLDRLSFFSGTSAPDTLAIGLSKSAADSLRINTIVGGDIIFTIEESQMMRIDDGTNEVIMVDSILAILDTGNSKKFQMLRASDRIIIDEPDKMQFQIGSITQFEITQGFFTFLTDKGIIANIDQLGFRINGNIIQDDTGGMVYSTIPGDSHQFDDGTTTFMDLTVGIALFENNFAGGGFYLDMFSRANPGVTGDAQRGRIYFDSNNSNHLSVTRNSAGIDLESPITTKGDLETFDTINTRLPIGTDTFVLTADSAEATGMKWAAGGGGGGNIISQGNSSVEVVDAGSGIIDFEVDGVDRMNLIAGELGLTVQIDMNTNDIEGIKAVEFTNSTSLPAGSVAYIQKNTVNMEFNVPSANGFIWHVNNGGGIFGIGVSVINVFVDFDMNFNNILDSGYLEFREPGITTGSLPANTRSWILLNDKGGSQSDMVFNISNVTNESFEFNVEGTNKFRINAGNINAIPFSSLTTNGGLDMNSTDITDCVSISSPTATALSFKIAGSTKWQITSAGILNAVGANNIDTSGGDIDMGTVGDILDCRDVFCDAVGILNHQVEFTSSVLKLFIFGSGDFITFDDGTGARIRYEYDNDDFSPLDSIALLGKSGRRWIEVWATIGTINTSFSEFKQDIQPQSDSDCLAACVNLEPIKFRWADGTFDNMKDKVNQTVRKEQVHFGYLADSLKQDMPEAVTGEIGQEGIYEQSVIALLIGSVRHLKEKNEALESRLAILEP